MDGKTYVSHFLRRADHEGGKVKNGAVASVEYASFFLVPPGFVWVPPKIRASPNFRAKSEAGVVCAAGVFGGMSPVSNGLFNAMPLSIP